MLPALALALLVAQTGDHRFGLVDYDPDGSKKPLRIQLFEIGAGASELQGVVAATDQKILKKGGNKPVRYAFPADADGDGEDELVLVRSDKKKNKRPLEIRVHERPDGIDGKAKLVASTSKKTFGNEKDAWSIVDVGAIDYDGDGRDEALIRSEGPGDFLLTEIRPLPQSKKEPMGPAVWSDGYLAFTEPYAVVAATGVDIDGNGPEEIVILRRAPGQPDRLDVHPSVEASTDLQPAIASYLDVGQAGLENVGLSRLDVDDDGAEELLLIRADADGQLSVAAIAPPTALDQTLSAPLAEAGPVITDSHVGFSVFGVRSGWTIFVPPPVPIEGEYEFWFNTEPALVAEADPLEPVGPFPATVTLLDENTIRIVTQTKVMEGTLTHLGPKSKEITFLPNEQLLLTFYPAGAAGPGDQIGPFSITSGIAVQEGYKWRISALVAEGATVTNVLGVDKADLHYVNVIQK